MDAVEHGKTVLASVIAYQSRKALDLMLRRLQPMHFTDPVQRNLYVMCERYLDQAGGVLTRAALADIMRTQPPGTAQMYQSYYDLLLIQRPQPSEFKWSVEQLRDLAAERMTGEALGQAMEVLTRGAKDGNRDIRGHADARSWLLARLGEIDRELHMQDAPEGDMRTELDPVLKEYAAKAGSIKHGGTGIATGIPALDRVLGGGFQRGELDLVSGFTTVGKSSFCAQVAWHACTVQRANVVIFTAETLRPQVRIKILARHSCTWESPGLNSRNIKEGTLSPQGLQRFQEVTDDFMTNPEYGKCWISQVPQGATLGILEAKLARIAQQFPVSLVIIDYLALLRIERRRQSTREELADIIKGAKLLAAGFNDGDGVPVLSPWQIKREALEEAKTSQTYTLSSLSETAEASNTADVILTLMETEERKQGKTKLKAQVLKNRDGEQSGNIKLEVDYATSEFSEESGSSTAEGEGMQLLI